MSRDCHVTRNVTVTQCHAVEEDEEEYENEYEYEYEYEEILVIKN